MFKTIDKRYLIGAVVGVAGTAAAIYAYKQNKSTVDEFLKKQGINIPVSSSTDYTSMSLEKLVSTKEYLEDILAERELALSEESSEAVVEA